MKKARTAALFQWGADRKRISAGKRLLSRCVLPAFAVT
jgi:hypothetical protein